MHSSPTSPPHFAALGSQLASSRRVVDHTPVNTLRSRNLVHTTKDCSVASGHLNSASITGVDYTAEDDDSECWTSTYSSTRPSLTSQYQAHTETRNSLSIHVAGRKPPSFHQATANSGHWSRFFSGDRNILTAEETPHGGVRSFVGHDVVRTGYVTPFTRLLHHQPCRWIGQG